MKPEEMSAVQERRFRKSVDYFRKNREIYVRRIKKIMEEYKNTVVLDRASDDELDTYELKPFIGEKLYQSINAPSATPVAPSGATNSFSIPTNPTFNLSGTTPFITAPPVSAPEAPSMFTPWPPVIGMDPALGLDPQFSFGMSHNHLALTTPTLDTSVGAPGYGLTYGMNQFLPTVPQFCGCPVCVSKSLGEDPSTAYCGVYASDDSSSSQIPGNLGCSLDPMSKIIGTHGITPYGSGESSELESDGQFDLQRYFSSTNQIVAVNSTSDLGSNSNDYTPPPPVSTDKRKNASADSGVDSDSSKSSSTNSAFIVDNNNISSAFGSDGIDYYASMNTFPNSAIDINATSGVLFPSYSQLPLMGAGDVGFRLSGIVGSPTGVKKEFESPGVPDSLAALKETSLYSSWSDATEAASHISYRSAVVSGGTVGPNGVPDSSSLLSAGSSALDMLSGAHQQQKRRCSGDEQRNNKAPGNKMSTHAVNDMSFPVSIKTEC